MIPPTAPVPISPAPASDLPVAPTGQSSLSAFDPSLSSAALAAQGASPAELGQHVMHSLNGFQADLSKMQGLTASMTGGASAPSLTGSATTSMPQTPSSQPQAGPAGQGGAPGGMTLQGTQPMVGLMMQTFNFAIETELVTRAATQFTGSVSTLMKGQ